jgi:hypothetical protein
VERQKAPASGDFFTVKRGLATGDNGFFILPKRSWAQTGQVVVPLEKCSAARSMSALLLDCARRFFQFTLNQDNITREFGMLRHGRLCHLLV